MTAKRFEICDVDLYEYGMPLNEIMDNSVPLSQNQVCELLNELHEENMMLKGEVAHYKLILMSLEKEAKRMSQIHCRGDVE